MLTGFYNTITRKASSDGRKYATLRGTSDFFKSSTVFIPRGCEVTGVYVMTDSRINSTNCTFGGRSTKSDVESKNCRLTEVAFIPLNSNWLFKTKVEVEVTFEPEYVSHMKHLTHLPDDIMNLCLEYALILKPAEAELIVTYQTQKVHRPPIRPMIQSTRDVFYSKSGGDITIRPCSYGAIVSITITATNMKTNEPQEFRIDSVNTCIVFGGDIWDLIHKNEVLRFNHSIGKSILWFHTKPPLKRYPECLTAYPNYYFNDKQFIANWECFFPKIFNIRLVCGSNKDMMIDTCITSVHEFVDN